VGARIGSPDGGELAYEAADRVRVGRTAARTRSGLVDPARQVRSLGIQVIEHPARLAPGGIGPADDRR